MPEQNTDIELINSYKKTGDKEYVGVLFTRYTSFVFALSLQYLKNEEDSKDAVMQIFESLFSKLHTHTIDNFKPWLYSVTKNYCLQVLRSQKKMKEIVTDSDFFFQNNMENDEDVHLQEKIDLEKNLHVLTTQIAGLREEQRICVELFYVKRLCYKEIAEQTGFSPKEVKTYIQNGKRNLQLALKHDT